MSCNEEVEEEQVKDRIVINYSQNTRPRKGSESSVIVEDSPDKLKIIFNNLISICPDHADSNEDYDDDRESVHSSVIDICISRSPMTTVAKGKCIIKQKFRIFVNFLCRINAKIQNTPFGSFICSCFCTCNNSSTDSVDDSKADADEHPIDDEDVK